MSRLDRTPPRSSSSGSLGNGCESIAAITPSVETVGRRVSSWCSEPGSQGFAQSGLRAAPHPRDISVGSDQHGGGSGDRAQDRKFPQFDTLSFDQLDTVSPRSDGKAAGLTEVEQ